MISINFLVITGWLKERSLRILKIGKEYVGIFVTIIKLK